ncbi:MAG: Nitrite reductase [NAD(P)H] large subunit, partial [uncultured Pseudonocardia sp.]
AQGPRRRPRDRRRPRPARAGQPALRRPRRRPLRRARVRRRPRRRRRGPGSARRRRVDRAVLRRRPARRARGPALAAARPGPARRPRDGRPRPAAERGGRLPLQHRHQGRARHGLAGRGDQPARPGPDHPRRHRLRELWRHRRRHLRLAGALRPVPGPVRAGGGRM